jgi:hypothetical protein
MASATVIALPNGNHFNPSNVNLVHHRLRHSAHCAPVPLTRVNDKPNNPNPGTVRSDVSKREDDIIPLLMTQFKSAVNQASSFDSSIPGLPNSFHAVTSIDNLGAAIWRKFLAWANRNKWAPLPLATRQSVEKFVNDQNRTLCAPVSNGNPLGSIQTPPKAWVRIAATAERTAHWKLRVPQVQQLAVAHPAGPARPEKPLFHRALNQTAHYPSNLQPWTWGRTLFHCCPDGTSAIIKELGPDKVKPKDTYSDEPSNKLDILSFAKRIKAQSNMFFPSAFDKTALHWTSNSIFSERKRETVDELVAEMPEFNGVSMPEDVLTTREAQIFGMWCQAARKSVSVALERFILPNLHNVQRYLVILGNFHPSFTCDKAYMYPRHIDSENAAIEAKCVPVLSMNCFAFFGQGTCAPIDGEDKTQQESSGVFQEIIRFVNLAAWYNGENTVWSQTMGDWCRRFADLDICLTYDEQLRLIRMPFLVDMTHFVWAKDEKVQARLRQCTPYISHNGPKRRPLDTPIPYGRGEDPAKAFILKSTLADWIVSRKPDSVSWSRRFKLTHPPVKDSYGSDINYWISLHITTANNGIVRRYIDFIRATYLSTSDTNHLNALASSVLISHPLGPSGGQEASLTLQDNRAEFIGDDTVQDFTYMYKVAILTNRPDQTEKGRWDNSAPHLCLIKLRVDPQDEIVITRDSSKIRAAKALVLAIVPLIVVDETGNAMPMLLCSDDDTDDLVRLSSCSYTRPAIDTDLERAKEMSNLEFLVTKTQKELVKVLGVAADGEVLRQLICPDDASDNYLPESLAEAIHANDKVDIVADLPQLALPIPCAEANDKMDMDLPEPKLEGVNNNIDQGMVPEPALIVDPCAEETINTPSPKRRKRNVNLLQDAVKEALGNDNVKSILAKHQDEKTRITIISKIKYRIAFKYSQKNVTAYPAFMLPEDANDVTYEEGGTVTCSFLETDWNRQCAPGIHGFLTPYEPVGYAALGDSDAFVPEDFVTEDLNKLLAIKTFPY